jgi:hypothetical protein
MLTYFTLKPFILVSKIAQNMLTFTVAFGKIKTTVQIALIDHHHWSAGCATITA